MKNSGERLEWVLKKCEQSHMRMTQVRKAILEFLSEQRNPVNLEAISQVPGVRDECDATTVYRTLMVFKDAGLVRWVGMLRKTSHFVLNVPGDVSHFLVCERCGAIEELELPANTLSTIRQLAVEHRFAAKRQYVEVQGLCLNCEAEARKATSSSKVMPARWSSAPRE